VAAIIVFVYLHFRARANERREGLRDIRRASRFHHRSSRASGDHSTTHHTSDHQAAGDSDTYSISSTSELRYGRVAPTSMLKAEGYQEIYELPSYEIPKPHLSNLSARNVV
jgi:hypothetical protein